LEQFSRRIPEFSRAEDRRHLVSFAAGRSLQEQKQDHLDGVTAARGHFATTRNGEVSEELRSTHSNCNNGSNLLKDGWSYGVMKWSGSFLMAINPEGTCS
jgi:hypothetical protein